MDIAKESGVAAMVLAFLGLDGILPYLLSAIVCVEIARTIDTYVSEGVFNVNIIRFIFTVLSLGLITAGVIDIMAQVVTGADPELTDPLVTMLWGFGLALLGRLVFDIIRERVEESSAEEALTDE